MLLLLLLLLCFVYLRSTVANSSAFTCSGEWPVVKNDTAASLKLLHCWLRNWQGDCTKGVYHGLGQGGGIGATIESAVRWLCFAIENGHYYRPDFPRGSFRSTIAHYRPTQLIATFNLSALAAFPPLPSPLALLEKH